MKLRLGIPLVLSLALAGCEVRNETNSMGQLNGAIPAGSTLPLELAVFTLEDWTRDLAAAVSAMKCAVSADGQTSTRDVKLTGAMSGVSRIVYDDAKCGFPAGGRTARIGITAAYRFGSFAGELFAQASDGEGWVVRADSPTQFQLASADTRRTVKKDGTDYGLFSIRAGVFQIRSPQAEKTTARSIDDGLVSIEKSNGSFRAQLRVASLVHVDPNCCYPTAGVVTETFPDDPSANPIRFEFTGKCGAVLVSTASGQQAVQALGRCN